MNTFSRASFGLFVAVLGFTSCRKDDEPTPAPAPASALRAKIDYATITAASSYTTYFKDANGAATVDLGVAATRLDMFTELNSYMATVAVAAPAAPATLDLARLRNLYANTNAPFVAPALNASGVQLRDKTAASFSDANATTVRNYIDGQLANLATASQSVNQPATPGNAGRVGRYLVDARGFEPNQVIQKALLGALLLDQIGNVLLTNSSLAAENGKVMEGKLYSAREHNWDMAYGYLTANAIMTTDIALTPRERFLAGYLNEKNGPASPGVYLALLKGRAAIVNNDEATLRAQADIIRTELERTLAKSAVSYLANWKAAADPAVKVHALGEGIGFVYSLRFCTKAGADAAWADSVLNGLTSGAQGGWSLTNAQADAAIAAINTKFSL